MIVVDTNVIASSVLRREDSALVRRALDVDRDWRVPPLWRSEFLSVLRHEIVTGRFSRAKAGTAWDSALALFGHREAAPEPRRVLAMISATLKSYDAELLALGEQLGATVVTNDEAFVRSSGGAAVTIATFLGAG